MNNTIRFLFVASIAYGAVAFAGEAAPEKPAPLQPSTWRPFKELPDVLFFETFEHVSSVADKGKLVADDPVPPGGHAWKLESGNNESFMFLHVSQTQLKIPHGLPPAQISVQISIYADEPGTVVFKAVTQKNENFVKEVQIPKVKMWNALSIKLSDMKNNKVGPEPENVWRDFEVHVKPPPKKKEVPKAWVDDILITLNSNPADVRPRALMAEKKRLDIEKQSERDGFTYSLAINDLLKASVKSFKPRIKQKRVLVLGPSGELTTALKDQLKLVAPKLKETTYTFDPLDEPGEGEKPTGGIADIRTMLYYNLQRDPAKVPEFVVLSLSPEEALSPGRPSEILRVAILRSLESGTVPIVCVPGPGKPEEKEKIEGFAKTVEAICHQLGVPMVNGGYTAKNAKGEVDAAKAAASATEKTALLAMTAMKHAHDSMAKD